MPWLIASPLLLRLENSAPVREGHHRRQTVTGSSTPVCFNDTTAVAICIILPIVPCGSGAIANHAETPVVQKYFITSEIVVWLYLFCNACSPLPRCRSAAPMMVCVTGEHR